MKGILGENQFLELSDNLLNEKTEYIKELETIEANILSLQSKKDNSSEVRKIIDKVLEFEKIDRNTLSLLVEKIVINLDKSIEVYFTFSHIY